MQSKKEECYEIKAIVQELKTREGDEEDVIKDWSSGIQAELGKYEIVVEELEELEQKLRGQEARRNSRRRGESET